MSLLETQLTFNALCRGLEGKFIEAGRGFRLAQSLRTDEQAAINALKQEGRAALAEFLEADPRFHALALAVKNNGKGDGILLSVHCSYLARDYDLFRKVNGIWVYLDKTEDHEPFGEWWEKQHPLARWGGRFRDGNHYSFEWQGRK